MRGERASGRVIRDPHLHRRQSRRFSSSPDARYYGGGGTGAKQGATIRGKGENGLL